MACTRMLVVSPGARRMAGAALAELQVDNYTAHRGAAVPKPGGSGVFVGAARQPPQDPD